MLKTTANGNERAVLEVAVKNLAARTQSLIQIVRVASDEGHEVTKEALETMREKFPHLDAETREGDRLLMVKMAQAELDRRKQVNVAIASITTTSDERSRTETAFEALLMPDEALKKMIDGIDTLISGGQMNGKTIDDAINEPDAKKLDITKEDFIAETSVAKAIYEAEVVRRATIEAFVNGTH